MRQHVAIRRKEYVTGGSARPKDIVFTQTHSRQHPVPWGRIAIGEKVWMKWSGGPIVARGIVEDFVQFENCRRDEFRNALRGTDLYHLDEYWESLPDEFHAMEVFVAENRWLDRLIQPTAKGFQASWIVIDGEEKEKAWLSRFLDEFEAERAEEDRKLGKQPRALPDSVRFQVLRRDDFACTYCGRSPPAVKLHVDHEIPRSKGGSNEISNLRTACAECNIGKGATLL